MNTIRDQFPLLTQQINGMPLVYLDYAATAPKPQRVLDAITAHYSTHAGNPGRGTHTLANEASSVIESARKKVLSFVKGDNTYSVIFTKSATESLNLIANSIRVEFENLEQKPTIIITEAEHHSNFLPWLQLHNNYNFPLHIVPVDQDGIVNVEEVNTAISQTPNSILAITICSNVTGQVVAISEIAKVAKQNNVKVVVDASQYIAHHQVELEKLNVDYLVASAHKMYGPEGVGLLIVKNELLPKLHPLIVGGGMVDSVSNQDFAAKIGEAQFEAGTPNTAGIAGLIAAIEFIDEVGFPEITNTESALTKLLLYELKKIPQIKVINERFDENRSPVVSFTCENIHPHDIADFLDQRGIEVRAGFHCAEPLHKTLQVKGTTRISLSFLNTESEILYLITTLKECLQKFA